MNITWFISPTRVYRPVRTVFHFSFLLLLLYQYLWEAASKRFAFLGDWEQGTKKTPFIAMETRECKSHIWRGGAKGTLAHPSSSCFLCRFVYKEKGKKKKHKQQRRTVTKNRANHTSQITSCMCGLSSAWNMELSSLLDKNSSLSVSA